MPSKYSSDLSSVYIGGGERDKTSVNPADIVDMQKLPDKTYLRVRLIGGVMQLGSYWVSTRKKDGSIGQFNTGCSSWNPETHSQDDNKEDPWRDFEREQIEAGVPRNDRLVRFATGYYMNAIIRNLQDNEPSRKPKPTAEELESGYKDKDSDTWTPVRVLSLPISVLDQIQKLKIVNVVKLKRKDGTVTTKTFDMNHPKYGCDLLIMYDSSKAGAAKYSVTKDDGRTPLSEEEQAYLTYDLDKLYVEFDPSIMQNAFNSWHNRNKKLIDNMFGKASNEDYQYAGNKDDLTENDLESKPRKKKKVEAVEDDGDFDDEDEVKPAKKVSRKAVEDDFDEEEESKPAKTVKKTKKKSEPEPEEDDEGFDDSDFEDDEEAKPVKKPLKKTKKKPEPEEDEDEDDFGDDDFDDEDFD